jgi:hypothetical protein
MFRCSVAALSVPFKNQKAVPRAAASPRFGSEKAGKERLTDKLKRALDNERQHLAAKKKLTWRERVANLRNFPIAAFVVFFSLWTFIGLRVVSPWRGFYAGEYPPKYDQLPPHIQEKVKVVPHWAPLPARKAP